MPESPARFDCIVVGSGYTGATFAERLAAAGRKVLVIDRRGHIAGNAYDAPDAHGVLVHHYGPHIFHTNSAAVRDYLSRFTSWRPYEHRTLGEVEGRLVPVPFNLNSLAALFPAEAARRIEAKLVAAYGAGSNVPILKLRQAEDAEIRAFADFVYARVFENYTLKQWGLRPEELSPSVTARVPVSVSRDDRLFQDSFQAMPRDGYTAMFGRILDHPNIDLRLNCDWSAMAPGAPAQRVLYTGAIDELLGYRFGPLPYRSLRFEAETLAQEQHQPAGIVTYPNAHAFTRITEHKIITGQSAPVTTIMREYPLPHRAGENTPYYPIPRDDNHTLYRRYRLAAEAEFPHFIFAGRLADYQYYNMDQACARGLRLAEQYLASG